MKKMTIFLVTLLSSACLQAATANIIQLKSIVDSTLDLNIYAQTDTTYLLNSKKPSGDGSSESAPVKVYVPIKSEIGGVDSADYFLNKAKNQTYDYVFNSVDVGGAAHKVLYPLYVSVLTTEHFMYAAVKDTDGYKIVKQYSGIVLKNISNTEINFSISPNEICAQLTTSTVCNNFKSSSSVYDTKDVLVHFFLSETDSLALGSLVTPGTGGLYFDTFFSNRIYPNLTIAINEVKKGDGRGIVSYKGSESIVNPLSIRAIERAASTTQDPIGSIGSAQIVTEEYAYAQDSYVTIRDLVNGEVYTFSIAFVDQFNYSSKLSKTFEIEPLKIQELLEKQACFLLTAGFGEEHFVIDYFRGFRDHFLAKFYLGRVFITTYYDLAPRYAIEIYNHEFIRFTIRVFAYVAYFLFSNIFLIMGLSVIAVSMFYGQKKLKNSRT